MAEVTPASAVALKFLYIGEADAAAPIYLVLTAENNCERSGARLRQTAWKHRGSKGCAIHQNDDFILTGFVYMVDLFAHRNFSIDFSFLVLFFNSLL